ncbi:MAG: PhnD/SsuA/transferrin family substrate-binding protein [Proteobacteria bacterium]|nr:PhnD/SsuA/transferrin family substrate-binding protein [Pseudomonadota bacterium]
MKKIGVALLGVIMLVVFAGAVQAEIKIGVLAKRGAETAMAKWQATGDYLTAKLGEPVTIIPLKFVAIEPMVKDGKIDFMLANSAFYVEMEKKYGAKAVSTIINSMDGKALKEFGGVVFVRADSPIQTLADIKGKKFMCVKYSSFGGAQMAWRLLLENGIDPQKDFATFAEGSKHDNVVLAVKSGVMDAGTVRSDTLERMAAEGKINMADFRVINQVKDAFPFVHSTILYPEWPMAALSHVDAGKAAKVGAALKAMTSDEPAAKNAKVVGWAPAADYAPVRDCLKAIKYGVFAN